MGNLHSYLGPMTNDNNAHIPGSEDDGGLTQAVSQLDAMNSGNPAASQAGWVLRDFKPDHAYLR
ncbi:hypothetical protein QBC46DRAFT_345848 [Diplogelasinospora grovesii]|uniref:Uncharacterized protein n=1 Tax=Diplogelasinospora grovesii TaxID=303347 RepID=A0AAN6MZ26_9PEZI|nr:hypothetical protein QBC46DRAFT_345848 [Diplogelasinospora grovesii]